jgi:HD-like signal output (HDOD) protein
VSDEAVQRQACLLEIMAKGLPPFPHTVLKLNALLSGPSADVKKAAVLIRTDPSLSAQVLRMVNSPLFSLRSRVISIEQAATLLGAERLRTLALSTSMAEFAGQSLPREESMAFWKHNFLAALLSEYQAKRTNYPEKGQAYIAGLLHDIGQVPQWMLACEMKAQNKDVPRKDWFDKPPIERDYFGMDHCEVGSRLAASWNLMPSFIDVLGNHHQPDQATHDPYLVQIVGDVERFLRTRIDAEPEDGILSELLGGDQDSESDSSQITVLSERPADDLEWEAIAADLEVEHARLLPGVERSVSILFGGSK